MGKIAQINAGMKKAGRGRLKFDHRKLKYLGFHVARPEGGPERLWGASGWKKGPWFYGHSFMIEPASMTPKEFRHTVNALVKKTLRADRDLVLFEPRQETFKGAKGVEQDTLDGKLLHLREGPFEITKGVVRGQKPTATEQKCIDAGLTNMHIGDVTVRGETEEALAAREREVYKMIAGYLKHKEVAPVKRR